MLFKDIEGKEITLEEIALLVENGKKYNYKVYIGSDSQIIKKKKLVQYVTCIVLHKEGKGGRVFIKKDKTIRMVQLRERLMMETYRSLQVAFQLQELLPKNVELIIHLDINEDKKYKSGQYKEELVGMILGQGLKCRIKPYSWAAATVADKFSKNV